MYSGQSLLLITCVDLNDLTTFSVGADNLYVYDPDTWVLPESWKLDRVVVKLGVRCGMAHFRSVLVMGHLRLNQFKGTTL